MQTQIDDNVRPNVKRNLWLEDAEKVVENIYFEHETIDDGLICREQPKQHQSHGCNKIFHITDIVALKDMLSISLLLELKTA